MSGSSSSKKRQKAAEADEFNHEKAENSLRSIVGEEIANVLVKKEMYDQKPFAKQRSHRLKEFASELLVQMGVAWPVFASYTPAVQRAALESTSFPPPHGSTAYFVCFFCVC
jgi:hypothetical protein